MLTLGQFATYHPADIVATAEPEAAEGGTAAGAGGHAGVAVGDATVDDAAVGDADVDMGVGSAAGDASSGMLDSNELILDGTTLVNLEILCNTTDGGRAGTLLHALEKCVSAQGKRLFTQWLCKPLRRVPDIEARCVAVAVGHGVLACCGVGVPWRRRRV
jgi:hypothetical protein